MGAGDELPNEYEVAGKREGTCDARATKKNHCGDAPASRGVAVGDQRQRPSSNKGNSNVFIEGRDVALAPWKRVLPPAESSR